MFVTRLVSGIVLVAIALLTICSGGLVLSATLLAVSLIGAVSGDKGAEAGGLSSGFCGISRRVFLLYTLKSGLYVLQYDGSDLHTGGLYVCIRILLSELSCGSGDGSIFRCCVRGCNALLHLSHKRDEGWSLSCVADFSLFLGMRYMCLLCGYADRKT